MNRIQAIEAFEENGFSKNPLQFVAEEILTGTGFDGYVRYGFLTVEQNRIDTFAQFKIDLMLRRNTVNSFTSATDGFFFLFATIEKTVLFDQWNLILGDSSNQKMYFIGYKMKI